MSFQKSWTIKQVEFEHQPWSHFRKYQRTALLRLWYFPPVIQGFYGVLTSLFLILSSFLPRNLPPWSFLTSFIVEFGRQPWSCFRKSQRTDLLCLRYFPPAIQVFSGVLTSFSNVLRVQIDLHFTKVQEILFKNFCSLAPVLSIFGAPVALFISLESFKFAVCQAGRVESWACLW